MQGRFEGKTVLVTGAASGIGRETALAFARAGADLVLCDVGEKGLSTTADDVRALGRTVLARRVDVADREAMRAFAEEVHQGRAAVDVLVNNAGVGLSGGLLDTTLDDWDWIVGINLRGVIHGCHFFVPPMVRARNRGQVVNVSSMAGLLATAELTAYSTTKFGVFGLSEALRDELRAHGIGVTTVCPGFVDTPIVASTRPRGSYARADVQARIAAFYRRRGYGPERVAAAIVGAVARRREVLPVTPEAWATYLGKRLAPGATARAARWLADAIAKR